VGAARGPGVSGLVTGTEVETAVAEAGLAPLPPRAGEQFAAYLELLLFWNSRLNLTAVRQPVEIVRRHLIESIQCAQLLPEAKTLLDFGSGAGLPGVPIAVVRPEIHVTLGESQGKKAAFLREAVRTLNLNADVYDGRVEKMAEERLFDVVTLRAVDRMEEASRVAVRRLHADGWLVVFATAGTERSLSQGLCEMEWKQSSPIVGLEKGWLMIGSKRDVSRGTSDVPADPV
jgi:16S rRNA (guanine527-N7)-methyltransferase